MERVKWGVIGAGGIADRRTLPGMMLADNAELVSVMEIEAGMAEGLREKYGAKKAYTSAEALLADGEVEAVYIASPIAAHYGQAVAAAAAGKHVLIEKPLAMTLAEGEALLALFEEQKLLFAAGLMMRFHPVHQQLRRMVAQRELGQVVSLRAQLTCWYPEIPGAWRQSLATAGGGALMDMGVHCIDLLQYITGSRAKRVAAFSGTKTFGYDVDDSASVLLEFENGAYGYVDSNFNIPDNAAQCRLELYGTGASALARGTIGQVEGGECLLTFGENAAGYDAAQQRGEGGGRRLEGEQGNLYTREIESFGASLRTGAPLEVPAAEALQVQRVIACAYEAARTGRTVDIP